MSKLDEIQRRSLSAGHFDPVGDDRTQAARDIEWLLGEVERLQLVAEERLRLLRVIAGVGHRLEEAARTLRAQTEGGAYDVTRPGKAGAPTPDPCHWWYVAVSRWSPLPETIAADDFGELVAGGD